jgi:hypothetical protein
MTNLNGIERVGRRGLIKPVHWQTKRKRYGASYGWCLVKFFPTRKAARDWLLSREAKQDVKEAAG